MNLQPITLFEMDPIIPVGSPTNRYGDRPEYLTIKRGRIGLSKPLYERLGCPEFAEVCIDRQKKILGIRKTDERNVNRYAVERYDKAGTALKGSAIIPQTICEVVPLDLEVSNYHAVPASTYGEFVIFDLEKLIPSAIAHRTKREA